MNTLLLVNRLYPCPEGWTPKLVSACPGSSIFLEQEAAQQLNRLMAVIDGWRWILPVSGWRSFAEQKTIYQDSLRENGPAFTEQYVALPGCSEHQTGLAIDLGLRGPEVDFLCPDFPYTGPCGDFRRLAADYGFVERYPAGKEPITGIAHEPWHFRYVGVPHARRMTAQGLALEEYLKEDGSWASGKS